MQRGRAFRSRYRDPVFAVIALSDQRKVHRLRIVKRAARLKRQRHRITQLHECWGGEQCRFANAQSLIQLRKQKRQKRQSNQDKHTRKRDGENRFATLKCHAEHGETNRAPKDREEPEKSHAKMLAGS